MNVPRTTQFAVIPEWVLFSGVSPTAIKLYAVLDRHVDDQSRKCFPSRKRLAERVVCSVRTVDRAMKELESIGAVFVARRDDDRGQTSNEYWLPRDPGQPGSGEAAQKARGMAGPLPISDEGALATDVALNENHVEREERELTLSLDTQVENDRKPPPKPRQRDLIFEALAEGLLVALDDVPRGRQARGKWNAAVASLREEGAEPEDVRAACTVYRELYPEQRYWTPTAIATHWPTLIAGARRERSEAEFQRQRGGA